MVGSFQKWLSCVILAWESVLEVIVKMSCRDAGIWRLFWGWKASLPDGTLTEAVGGASAPHHMDLSSGCLSVHSWHGGWLHPGQEVQERVSKSLKCL